MPTSPTRQTGRRLFSPVRRKWPGKNEVGSTQSRLRRQGNKESGRQGEDIHLRRTNKGRPVSMMNRPILCVLPLLLVPAGTLRLAAAEPGLIAHWKLAGDVRDHSGEGRDGVNRGADLTAEGPDGKPAGAARFDGRDDVIEVPAARAFK